MQNRVVILGTEKVRFQITAIGQQVGLIRNEVQFERERQDTKLKYKKLAQSARV